MTDLELANHEYHNAEKVVNDHFKRLLDYSNVLVEDDFELLRSEILEVRMAGDYRESLLHVQKTN